MSDGLNTLLSAAGASQTTTTDVTYDDMFIESSTALAKEACDKYLSIMKSINYIDMFDDDNILTEHAEELRREFDIRFSNMYETFNKVYPVYKDIKDSPVQNASVANFRVAFGNLCRYILMASRRILENSENKDNDYNTILYVIGLLEQYECIESNGREFNGWYFYYAKYYVEFAKTNILTVPSDVNSKISIILTDEFYDGMLLSADYKLSRGCRFEIELVIRTNGGHSDKWRYVKRFMYFTSLPAFRNNNAVQRFGKYLDAVSYYALLGKKDNLLDFLSKVPELQPEDNMDADTEMLYNACKIMSSKEFLLSCCDEAIELKSRNKAPDGVPIL